MSLSLSEFPKASNYHDHPNGKLYQGNSIDWLASLDDASVDLVFADPPYNESRLGQFREPRTHYRVV